jgi:competence protein ComEC
MAQGHIASPLDIIILRKSPGDSFQARFWELRRFLVNFIHQNTTPKARGIILAMTLGERGQIPPEINDSFRVTGTAHILAISGLHVGIIVSFCFLISLGIINRFEWLLLRFNAKIIACAITIFPVIAYALLSGGSVSVQRATLMTLAFLAALSLGRARDLGNVLAFAAIVILGLNPEKLWNISFQLSFSAVWGIFLLLPHFPQPGTQTESWSETLARLAKSFLLVTIGATLGTWPLVAYHFHYFSLLSPLANFIVVPALGFLVLPLSLAAILISFVFEPLAVLLLQAASQVVHLVVYLTHLIASLPFCFILIVPPPGEVIAFYYIFLVLAAGAREITISATVKSPIRFSPGLALLFILVSPGFYWFYQHKPFPSGHLEVTMLDVGQGSSSLVLLPTGERLLVDGGGLRSDTFDVGKQVIAPFLLNRGINKLDLVILTHPHRDHLQGLIYILEQFPVREVWTNGEKSTETDWLTFTEILKRKKIPHRVMLSEEGAIKRGGAIIRFFNPSGEEKKRPAARKLYDKINEGSLVFKITFGNHCVLFTGDIGQVTEERLVRANYPLTCQVLMVPHHGSRFSSSEVFLDAVQPKVALVSARSDGLLKLPHPETIQRYDKRAVTLLRTDRQGAVTLKSDGMVLMIESIVESE